MRTMFLLLIMVVVVAGQRAKSIQGWMLADTTISVDNLKEGFDVVADTTALKALTVTTPGARYYLKQLSSANANGGGEFVYYSSGYTANGVTVFDAAGGGYFVRKAWLNNKANIFASWSGFSTSGTAINNSNNIDRAIAVARVNGGGITIDKGTFLVEHKIILNWDGAFLRGAGRYATIIKRSPTFDNTYGVISGNGIILVADLTGADVRDLTIDADYKITSGDTGSINPILANNTTGVTVENCRIINITGHTYGIWIRNSKIFKVLNNYVSGDYNDTYSLGNNNKQEGIEISQGNIEDGEISGNTVEDISNNGIYAYFSPINDTAYVHNIKIHNNTIKRVAGGGLYFELTASNEGTSTKGYKYLNVYKNHVEDAAKGFFANIPSASVTINGYAFQRVNIEGNTFISCDQTFWFGRIKRLSIINNTIDYDSSASGSSSSPFYFDGNVDYVEIAQNHIYGSAYHGLALTSNVGFAYVHDNYFLENARTGIYLLDNHNSIVANNLILNNNTSGDLASNYLSSGIGMIRADTTIFDGNYIIDTRTTKLHKFGIYNNNPSYAMQYRDNIVRGVASTGYENELNMTDSTEVYWGKITLSAATTSTRVYCKRYSGNDVIMIKQTKGADINVKLQYTTYTDGFSFTHSSAVGDEEVAYIVLP